MSNKLGQYTALIAVAFHDVVVPNMRAYIAQ